MTESSQNMTVQIESDPAFTSAFGARIPNSLTGPRLLIMVRATRHMALISAMPKSVAPLVDMLSKQGFLLPVESGLSVRCSNGTLVHCQSVGRWLVELSNTAALDIPIALGALTDLGHARCSFVIEGGDAIELAQKLAPIDFALERHGPMSFVQSGSDHSIDIALWRVQEDRFVVYVERSFARDFWNVLEAESAEFRV